jgi:hypothetical protein
MKKLKYVKTFESFKINEEIAGLAGGIAIGALFAYLSNFVPRLSNNPIKSISRFVKMSRVIKKYKPLIEELDVMFKNDPKINQFYKDIKTIGHGTSNQTTPATYASMLKDRILHRVPTSMRPKVEDLMRELEKEVKEVGYDVYGEDSYSFESLKINEEINLKGLAAGAMMALMTACNNGEVNGESAEGYNGDMLVKRIEMGGGKHNFFLVHGFDEEGKYVEFRTDNLTFNVGDSIHVDFSKEEAYPLDDKGNIGNFGNQAH